MKVTKKQLKQMIKEELSKTLRETYPGSWEETRAQYDIDKNLDRAEQIVDEINNVFRESARDRGYSAHAVTAEIAQIGREGAKRPIIYVFDQNQSGYDRGIAEFEKLIDAEKYLKRIKKEQLSDLEEPEVDPETGFINDPGNTPEGFLS